MGQFVYIGSHIVKLQLDASHSVISLVNLVASYLDTVLGDKHVFGGSAEHIDTIVRWNY